MHEADKDRNNLKSDKAFSDNFFLHVPFPPFPKKPPAFFMYFMISCFPVKSAFHQNKFTMITFNPKKYDGFIFDCDGTLADTMPLHYQAWSETLALKLGRSSDFTESMFYRFGGMPARQIIERLNRDFGYNLPVEQTAHDKEMRFVELLPGIGPIQEVIDVLNRLGPDAKVAVASGGLTEIVRETLLILGLSVGPVEKIKFLIGSDQVTHGKPHPDLFLPRGGIARGRTRNGVSFSRTRSRVFVAAKAAGMDYIDVRPFRASMADAAKH